MSEHDEDLDELAELQALVGEQKPKPVIRGFDTAALFLLSQQHINLFEPLSAAAGASNARMRCKGCGGIVPQKHLKNHYDTHKRALARGDYGQGGTKMATAPKTNAPAKVTAKDQGWPAAYLAPNGNFKPGLDAAAKSDAICTVLGVPNAKARATFTVEQATKLIKARGWESQLERKREILAAKVAKAAEAKTARASSARKTAAAKKTGSASKSTAAKSGVVIKPDFKRQAAKKTGAARKKTRAASSRSRSGSRSGSKNRSA